MRIHQPMPVRQALNGLLASPDVADAVVAHRILPPRPADLVDVPGWLDPRLRSALEARGMPALYTAPGRGHRGAAAGEDVLVVDADRVGQVPVLPPARAPGRSRRTRPRGRCTCSRPRRSAGPAGRGPGAGDGRRAGPQGRRLRRRHARRPSGRPIRTAGQVVVTNPDMLHAAILPHHTAWFQLFEQLRYVVVDEAHTYRGIFGSHVANVLRRLLRICAHYGSRPAVHLLLGDDRQPAELAETLTGRAMRVVDRNGAPTGEKHVVVLQPAGASTGDRRSGPARSASRAGPRMAFLRAGRQTIVFGRSRVPGGAAADLAPRGRCATAAVPSNACGATAAATCPSERRAIEPGCARARSWAWSSHQRARAGHRHRAAGRRGARRATRAPSPRPGSRSGAPAGGRSVSVAVLVAGAGAARPVRGARHPDYLFEAPPEEARLDPDNIHVLLAHLRAAAFELPFDAGERFGPATRGRPAGLPRRGGSRPPGGRRALVLGERELPGVGGRPPRRRRRRTCVIIDTGPDRPRVIGEVDLFSAPTLVHEDAIYLHESRQYHVDRLDWEERKAYVRPVDVDHYTQARAGGHPQAARVFASRTTSGEAQRAHGEVMVSTLATIYKKLKLDTHENLGWGRIHLPETELHSTAWWLALAPARRPAGGATTSTGRSSGPAARSRPSPACCS